MASLRVVLRRIKRGVVVALAVLVAGAVVALVASRDARYVARAAVEEARILARRRSIPRVIADPGTDAATRGKLSLVLAVRDFAAESLHLNARQTYTTYSRVDRDTLVLVLTASRADALSEVTWWYPVVGRVPYKGFFSPSLAAGEQRRLERQGLDTYLRVSNAFSTLGWFNDPLLSTIVREDSADLAATVVHEILHNTVWVTGNVAFNESFAEFVGYRGAEAFFHSRGDSLHARFAAARWRDEIRLAGFYDSLAQRLRGLYTSGLGRAAVLERREPVFASARAALAASLGGSLETIDGRYLARRPLNNAVVIAQRLYATHLDAFDRLLAARGGSLERMIGEVRKRAAGGGDPWTWLGPAVAP